jgi:hypothetical protein
MMPRSAALLGNWRQQSSIHRHADTVEKIGGVLAEI